MKTKHFEIHQNYTTIEVCIITMVVKNRIFAFLTTFQEFKLAKAHWKEL